MRSARVVGWCAAAGLALVAGGGARAQESGGPPFPEKRAEFPVSSDEAAKIAIERFEQEFRSADEIRKMNAIQMLARTRNDLVVKRLGALLGHPSVDVRMAAATVLDDQRQSRELAGELLRKCLSREQEADVLCTHVLSLGRLDYKEAVPEMGELMLKHENVYVKIEVLKAFGKMKDRRALLPILDLWLITPQGYSWEGGEEHYDSGAPGDHDQKEAERRYKEKHKNDQRRGAPPTMMKTYIQAIVEACEKITGEKIPTPTDLMLWLVAHEAELPFKLPGKVKTVLKEYQERAKKREERKK